MPSRFTLKFNKIKREYCYKEREVKKHYWRRADLAHSIFHCYPNHYATSDHVVYSQAMGNGNSDKIWEYRENRSRGYSHQDAFYRFAD